MGYMTGWQNDFVTKWLVENDKWQHDKMTVTKWQHDKMTVTKWQHDKMTVTKWQIHNMIKLL